MQSTQIELFCLHYPLLVHFGILVGHSASGGWPSGHSLWSRKWQVGISCIFLHFSNLGVCTLELTNILSTIHPPFPINKKVIPFPCKIHPEHQNDQKQHRLTCQPAPGFSFNVITLQRALEGKCSVDAFSEVYLEWLLEEIVFQWLYKVSTMKVLFLQVPYMGFTYTV